MGQFKSFLFSIYMSVYISFMYIRYSSSVDVSIEREIELIVHSIEKGLSNPNFRAGFGRAKIRKLTHLMGLKSKGDYFYELGLSALKSYKRKHDEYGYDVSEYCGILKSLKNVEVVKSAAAELNEFKINAGTDIMGRLDDPSKSTFEELARTRHSVRCYKDTRIDKDTLERVINLAKTAPSACNRQAVKVYVVTDCNKIAEIARLQKGYDGFGGIPCWLIVTSDLKYYAGSDLKMILLDAGLFTMNLILSIKYYGFDSCVLHCCLRGNAENRIKNLCNIPRNEMITNFVVAGEADYSRPIPHSQRKPDEMLLVFDR